MSLASDRPKIHLHPITFVEKIDLKSYKFYLAVVFVGKSVDFDIV